jgi:hypothetical protein
MLNEIDKDQIDEIYVEDFMHGSTEIFISCNLCRFEWDGVFRFKGLKTTEVEL